MSVFIFCWSFEVKGLVPSLEIGLCGKVIFFLCAWVRGRKSTPSFDSLGGRRTWNTVVLVAVANLGSSLDFQSPWFCSSLVSSLTSAWGAPELQTPGKNAGVQHKQY